MKKIAEVARVDGWKQREMFPETYHEHYKVLNHHMMIGEDGKSYWAASEITWRLKAHDASRDS